MGRRICDRAAFHSDLRENGKITQQTRLEEYTLGNTYQIGIDICVGVTTTRGWSTAGLRPPVFRVGRTQLGYTRSVFLSLSVTLFLSIPLKLATILAGCLYGKGRAARRVQLYRTRTESFVTTLCRVYTPLAFSPLTLIESYSFGKRRQNSIAREGRCRWPANELSRILRLFSSFLFSLENYR